MKKAFGYPNLIVHEDGKVFNNKTKTFLPVSNNVINTRGPAVYYNDNGRTRYLAIQTLVYECYIKNGKKEKGIVIDPIDGNIDNVHHLNLQRRKKKADSDVQIFEEEKVYGYNGSDEIFC